MSIPEPRRPSRNSEFPSDTLLKTLAACVRISAQAPDTMVLYKETCGLLEKLAGVRSVWAGAREPTGVWEVFFGRKDFPEGKDLAENAWIEGKEICGVLPSGSGSCFLPVFLRARVQGLLVVCLDGPEISGEIPLFLETIVCEIGAGLLRLDLQRSFHLLENLYVSLVPAVEELLPSREPGLLLQGLCQTLVRGELFDAAWIGEPGPDGGFRDLARAGAGADAIGQFVVNAVGREQSLVFRCRTKGEIVVVRFPGDLVRSERTLFAANHWKTGIAVPVSRDGVPDMILFLASGKEWALEPDVREHCRRIARLLGHSLSDFALREKLADQVERESLRARLDPLTGLPNRLSLEDGLGGAVGRARRTGTLMAVCMLDLDNFKTLNDQNGHAAGDLVLRQLAERFRQIRREGELLARMGGDEFVLVLEGLGGPEDLAPVFERIRSIVLTPFSLGEGQLANLDLSAGVALYPLDGDDPDLLLRRADNALYSSKIHKNDRPVWWKRWESGEVTGERAPAYGLDPYGAESAQILERTESFRLSVTEGFGREFYENLRAMPGISAIIDRVSPEEMRYLEESLNDHLSLILSIPVSRETVFMHGQSMGRTHSFVGVDRSQIDESFRHFQRFFQEKVLRSSFPQEEKVGLLSILLARLKDATEGQFKGLEWTMEAYHSLLGRNLPSTGSLMTDVIGEEMERLGQLPGIKTVILFRPDREGVFVPVFSHRIPEEYQGFLTTGGDPPVLDTTRPAGRGLLPMAWLDGRITSSPVAVSDPRLKPWWTLYQKMGIRSAVAIPVFDVHGKIAYVLHLSGEYPGQFESDWMRQFCEGLSRRGTLLLSRPGLLPIFPEVTSRRWRDRLFSGGLRMVYQPVINLMGGFSPKVEALARLEMEDGQTVLPGQFIGVLGEQELDRLFWHGLSLALSDLRKWEAGGLNLGLSVNAPPFVLTQPDFLSRLRETLRKNGVSPNRLYLELLESLQMEMNNAFVMSLQDLSRLGVHIVMDDLGSGYSSLERLRSLPFEAVKIDQSLIRNARTDPYRTVSFIGMLVQLGRDLDMSVVVEGLEFLEQVEIASFLGAHFGQGFFLATPMPAMNVAEWCGHFSRFSPIHIPRTALGALALHWRMTHSSTLLESSRYRLTLEDCPNTRFLEDHGLSSLPAGVLHRKIHELKTRGVGSVSALRTVESEFSSELVRLIVQEKL
ncbi:MAG: EAL domain-containing protein [Nitrospirae bacterium]|nr:EAL domain-containing protein [Nitrospirota bacterium]